MLGLAAAGLAAGGRRVRAQTQLTPLTVTMEFTPQGLHSPYYLARQKGWFKEAGIDLMIKDGKGSATTLSLVGAGQSDFGFVTLSAMAIARAKGVPVKAVANMLHKNAYGLILRKGAGLKKPEDFKGKEVPYNTSAIEGILFNGFMASAGLSSKDVKMLGVDASAKMSGVISGKGDAAVAPVPFYVGLLEGKQEIESVLFADFGQKMIDFGIVTTDGLIARNPAIVKAFTAVVSRAYQYTFDGHFDEAAAALVADRPDAGLDARTAANMCRANIPHLYSPSSEGKPIGFQSAQDWADTVDSLARMGLVPKATKAADMYDPSFLPA